MYFWKIIRKGLKIFCKNTSLHGFSYIVSKNHSPLFRIFFSTLCLFNIVFFLYLGNLQVFSSNREIIRTTILTTTYPVQNVPFPAVTIGNFNLVYKDNVRKFAEKLEPHGVTAVDFEEFAQHLVALIIYTYNESDLKNYSKIYTALDAIGYSIKDLMAELAQPCSSMMEKCIWKSKEVNCSSIFDLILTNEGHACSFNYRGVPGFKGRDINENMYAGGGGETFGLKVILDIEPEQYVSSNRKNSYGLSVLIHDSIEYPHISMSSKILLPRELMTLSVTPSVYHSTDALKFYSPEKRKCWFENEGWDWPANYSFIGCIEQCKEEGKFKKCNCVSYHYPNKLQRRYCTLQDTDCLQTNKIHYSNVDITGDFQGGKEQMFSSFGNVTKCNCHPQCNERFYDVHMDKIQLTTRAANTSILSVYFNTIACTNIQRDVYMTWDQILAALGGLFGLCLGGSVVSLVEIVYFTFKGICALIKQQSRNRKVVQIRSNLIKVSPMLKAPN